MAMMQIEAQASFNAGHAEVVRRLWDTPIDVLGAGQEHRVEFAMLPRSEAARACYPDHPALHQFERFGDVFFFPAGELVHARSDCRHQYSVVCSFRPDAVNAWFDRQFCWTDARLQASLNIANPAVRQLLGRLGDELRHPGFASAAMIDMLAGQISLELVRHLIGIDSAAYRGGLPAKKLRMIEERLGQDGASPSLTELAGLCGLSVRHLTRAFRASRHCSLGDHIAARRLERVQSLLAEGNSVKSIAYLLGFSSPAALSTAFRRATGERPRDYLQRADKP
jgi:AraC family transcriptional regulator